MTTRSKLETLASNLWWSWHPEAIGLFEQLNPEAFKAATNSPKAALMAARAEVIEDTAFKASVDEVYASFTEYMQASPRFGDAQKTSYFCMEYGLHESLPLYSGGLGILAGDHTKAASDVGLPLTAVGLFLRDGYFKQYFDLQGNQQAEFPSLDATLHPFTLVTDEWRRPITVTVQLGWQPLHLRVWRIDVGRVPMYLLDSDFDANPFTLRFLTRRLYAGNRQTRIQQEIILGIGGLRMLRAMGIEADVYHMNEGHCGFLTLELLRERQDSGEHREAAEAWVREHTVFTTHTPVMAGHDRFDPDLFLSEMSGFRERLHMSEHDLLAYGRVNPHDITEQFTMTVLGLKLARKANGVSKLNGEVARRQWHHLYADRPVEQVPIGHVTNGIHLPTWTAPHARPFLKQHLGDWLEQRDLPSIWKKVDDIPAQDLWNYRRLLRSKLISFVEAYTPKQTLPQTPTLNPDVLTIGFARRFATYKRAPLLFHDLERAIALFNHADRPIQVIYAGKAHPADKAGQEFIHQIYEFTQHADLKGKLVFLENYNMEIGRMLVSGCDVWLNNPRRPYEASGTSGQKVAIHGGLNLSILDGWWPEGYNGNNGWPIGQDDSHEYKDPLVQDPEDAYLLYETLQDKVVPMFYDLDEQGLPHRWIEYSRNALRTLSYAFSAHRMVVDYIEQVYSKGHNGHATEADDLASVVAQAND